MFGEIVSGHRRRLGLTQEELAELTGISVRGIRNLEAGRSRAPRPGTLRVLAEVFTLEGAERERLFSSAPGAPWPAPGDRGTARFSLPPDTVAFTGRAPELASITSTVAAATRHGGVVVIHAIDGMPGIGKTTLAVHAAHQLAGRYPDGQMFLDLHAHTPGRSPTDPADALADLLRADGVDPRQLPDSVAARTAMWRDRMKGRRALVVLDNVHTTQQVAPLLPGSDTVLVLITSRRRLGDLRHAAHLHLAVLPHADAVALFTRLAPRADGEPDAVGELVRLCDHLPLAIAIVASRFSAHPTWAVGDLLAEFRAGRDRMLTVKSENATVQAAFDLSYQRQTPARQRFFRLLGLTPGVSIDSHAAAALTGVTFAEAAEHLDELYNDHLLDETAPHRYQMHDLIRAYTRSLAVSTEPDQVREQAIEALMDYYQHTAHRADALIADHTQPAAPTVTAPSAAPDLPGWDAALAWLRAERPNVEACLQHAAATAAHRRVAGLTAGLATLLRRDGPLPQAIELHQEAARAAGRAGEVAGRAGALHELAVLRRLTGDYPAANDLLRQALTVHTETGDRLGQGNALHELGCVLLAVGDYPAADDLLHRGMNAFNEVGDRRGRANVLYALGIVRLQVGDYPAADSLLHQALTIRTEIGHRRGQAIALHNLGIVRRQVGDVRAADGLLHQALSIHVEAGDRLGQAHTLHELAIVRRQVGDYPAAESMLRQALATYAETDNRLGQASALFALGVVRLHAGDYPQADSLLHQALASYAETGDRHGEAYTSTQLGAVRYLSGDHTQAETLLQQALKALRDIGVPDDEAETLNHLGNLRRITGDPGRASACHTEALALARRVHYRIQEAHALQGLGRAALDLGEGAVALTYLRQALDMYRQLGVPDAENVASVLSELPSTDEAA